VSKLASPARYTFIDDVLGIKGIVDPSGKTRIVLETLWATLTEKWRHF
jgi:hypothetical protein